MNGIVFGACAWISAVMVVGLFTGRSNCYDFISGCPLENLVGFYGAWALAALAGLSLEMMLRKNFGNDAAQKVRKELMELKPVREAGAEVSFDCPNCSWEIVREVGGPGWSHFESVSCQNPKCNYQFSITLEVEPY